MLMSLVSPRIAPAEVNIVTGQLTSTLGCNRLSLPSMVKALDTFSRKKPDIGPPLK
jgi:hypothetical protein